MDDFFDVVNRLVWQRRLSIAPEDQALLAKLHLELQRAAGKIDVNLWNIESIFGIIEMAKTIGLFGELTVDELDRSQVALTNLISSTLDAAIVYPWNEGWRPTAAYDQLANACLNVQDTNTAVSLSIVTFNYDIALDYALHYRNVNYDYRLTNSHADHSLAYCKLHGSVNWLYDGKSQLIRTVDFPSPNRRYRVDSPTLHMPLADMRTHLASSIGCEDAALLAPPTESKLAQRVKLAPVWRAAADALQKAAEVYVVGFSLPPTDDFVRNFLAVAGVGGMTFQRIVVVNPDPRAADRIKSFLSPNLQRRFEWEDAKFEKYVGRFASYMRDLTLRYK